MSSSESSDLGLNADLPVVFVKEVRFPALALLKSYGITDQEIIAEFGSLDSAMVVLAAEAVVQAENLIDDGITLTFFEPEDYSLAALAVFGINKSYAQTDTFGGCLADAIGITAAFEILEKGVAGLGKKGVLKLIKKIGGKYLGYIGVALAAYDFADCMGWL